MAAHPELAAEQAYVDRAYDALEAMRDLVARAATATDQEVAALALERWSAKRLATYDDAEQGLLFGRLDYEDVEHPLYVGRRWVEDGERHQLVVNWQAPAARPFYTATPHDPQRVTLRRRFRTRGRRLLDIADETLDGSTVDGAAVADFLLEELERSRDAHMRDIVATIQADQYRLITADPDHPLVIQGGPGTGKTAVGLHRASWILYTQRERLARSRVLVVGPNPTFMEYVSHVLPALGETAVEQRAVSELVDGVRPARAEKPDVAALKGDARLANVLARAAELRLAGAPEELLLRLDGAYVRVREREVRELLDTIRGEHGTTAVARERFRMGLVRRFYADYGRVHGGAAWLDGEQVEAALRKSGALRAALDAAWPPLKPERLVRSLLADAELLEEAADGLLDEAEQRALRRRGGGWGDADVALLDEAHALVGTPPRTFGHVVVDEAQDLTPMQLRAVGRRARDAAVTLLGDVAQATGPIPYAGWDEVLPHLPDAAHAAVEELRHAYRVPRELMELALPLLDEIAPGLQPPLSYRTGAAPPLVRRVAAGDLAAEAYREVARLADADGLVALIAPDELERELVQIQHDVPSLDDVPVLTPREAKGLEFDHVIVLEPALVVRRPQGLRELYVALTRPTRSLVVLHARPLPAPLA